MSFLLLLWMQGSSNQLRCKLVQSLTACRFMESTSPILTSGYFATQGLYTISRLTAQASCQYSDWGTHVMKTHAYKGQEEPGSRSISKTKRRVFGSSHWRLFSLIPKPWSNWALTSHCVLESFPSSFHKSRNVSLNINFPALPGDWTPSMWPTHCPTTRTPGSGRNSSMARWHASNWPGRSQVCRIIPRCTILKVPETRWTSKLDRSIRSAIMKWSAGIFVLSWKNWHARLMNSVWISYLYRFSAGAPSYTSLRKLWAKQQPTSRNLSPCLMASRMRGYDLLWLSDKSRKRNCPTHGHGNTSQILSLYIGVSIVGISQICENSLRPEHIARTSFQYIRLVVLQRIAYHFNSGWYDLTRGVIAIIFQEFTTSSMSILWNQLLKAQVSQEKPTDVLATARPSSRIYLAFLLRHFLTACCRGFGSTDSGSASR